MNITYDSYIEQRLDGRYLAFKRGVARQFATLELILMKKVAQHKRENPILCPWCSSPTKWDERNHFYYCVNAACDRWVEGKAK